MNILAIDDEEIALEGLVSAAKKAESSATIYSFRKPKEALERGCTAGHSDAEYEWCGARKRNKVHKSPYQYYLCDRLCGLYERCP